MTEHLDLAGFPTGTRCIIRREPLHPGAQRSLFPSHDYRYWGFYTDAAGDPVALDVTMRAHAHVESHIQRLKESGLCRFPFTKFEANSNWLMTVALAADLVRRCVSSLLRQFLIQFSEPATSFTGWLIHATVGSAGGVGILRTNRSG